MTPSPADRKGEVDGRAFGELLAEFRPGLRRMVTIRLDPGLSPRIDASDVIQETYVEVARRIEAYRASAEMPFFLWVRQIAHQKLIDLHRKHLGASKRDVRREGGVPDLSSSISLAHALTSNGSSPSRIAVRAEQAQQLRDALEGMREIDREILLLRHFEGLTIEHCSQLMGISISATKMRQLRALEHLGEILREHGGSTDYRPLPS